MEVCSYVFGVSIDVVVEGNLCMAQAGEVEVNPFEFIRICDDRIRMCHEFGMHLLKLVVMAVKIMLPRVMTRSAGRPVAKSLGGGTGVRVGRGGRGKRPREGLGANGGVEGVNRNVEGANGGAPDFSTIIAQQLQNLLPTMLA
ncbi:hypothetical protein Tco_0550612 [Tanacetum coccineum]